MKPERIQFWLRLIARWIGEVLGKTEETGKHRGSDDSAAQVEE